MAYVKKEDRNPFRDLRHKLIGTPEEIEKYEAEIQEDLRSDAKDHIKAAQAVASKEKKDGLEGLGSK